MPGLRVFGLDSLVHPHGRLVRNQNRQGTVGRPPLLFEQIEIAHGPRIKPDVFQETPHPLPATAR